MKLLIVEDDPLYASLLERYLEGLADEIAIVDSWEAAEAFVPTAHMMWLDLVIPPHNDDYAFLRIRAFRDINRKAVIFVVSGIPDDTLKEKALQAGADGFAHKMDATSQTQVIALMISALMKVQERGYDCLKFLQRARELLSERINPQSLPPQIPLP